AADVICHAICTWNDWIMHRRIAVERAKNWSPPRRVGKGAGASASSTHHTNAAWIALCPLLQPAGLHKIEELLRGRLFSRSGIGLPDAVNLTNSIPEHLVFYYRSTQRAAELVTNQAVLDPGPSGEPI